MPPYRCYFLDGANHIVGFEACECADDASAVGWAASLSCEPEQTYHIEVWCRDRLVDRQERAVR
jgi:hypothetical protein